jgi:tetratricopeptide (TPR) repeat protein
MMIAEGVNAMRLAGLTLTLFLALSSASAAASAQTRSAKPADGKQSAASAFEEGQNAQERGELASAVRFYTTAIAADASLFQAYYQRAVAQMELGRLAEAEADLRKVIELQPGFARAHRALGQILLDRGMTDDAKRELARAIELDAKLRDVRIYYASALIKSDETALAIEQLRAALAQGESSALIYALLGIAQEKLGKSEEAFSDYVRAIEIDPNNATAREGRARIFEARGELARAIEDYTAAYRAQPSVELAIKLAGVHARAGQPQAAIQLYRGALREKPTDLVLRAEMARLMAENGQAEEAVKEIENLIALQPGNARLLALAGDIYFAEKPERAAELYRRAVEADPRDARARVQFGAALVRSMKYEEALTVLTEAIKLEPENYPARANLATALFKLKLYPQAAGQFIWLVRARPETAASYFFLAISLDRLGDCQQALRAYQEFVRRADAAANKNELEEASIRVGMLQRLAKEGKCKSAIKGRGK